MSEAPDRTGRARRAALCSGGVVALFAVAAFVLHGAGFASWWVLVPVGVLVAVFAGQAGARMGREDAVRAQALEPGGTVLGAHTVRPPYRCSVPGGCGRVSQVSAEGS
ncbi:hypothetical protein ACFWUZ_13415 [Streptomyces sp. NPDC058646]|uniref:hypothetical protein n=1 Tax=Streptomyces sp. NPDC058646 TaxID=3346574 RepID=UPI00364E18D2